MRYCAPGNYEAWRGIRSSGQFTTISRYAQGWQARTGPDDRLAKRRGILGRTMSPNIELVRRWYALLPSLGSTDPNDDPAFIDRMFRDYLDEEYELRLPGGYPEGEPVFRGREGFAHMLAMLRDAWAEWRFEPERFIEAGDQIVVFVRVV